MPFGGSRHKRHLGFGLLAARADRNSQAELPLALSDAWSTLPTTKVRRPSPEAPFAWAYTYTAFSLQFANATLELLGACPHSSVLDPFAGSGTTMVAAASHGSRALGVDVSPFASLLSRTRLAFAADSAQVQSYLEGSLTEKCRPSGDAFQVLGHADSAYAKGVIDKMLSTRGLAGRQLWTDLLADDEGAFDSEAVTLLALAIGARDCAKLARGSNPIWLRRIQEAGTRPGVSLNEFAMMWAANICRDLRHVPPTARTGCRVLNADITRLKLLREFDICLTSPPYLNRLDYVVAHLPELSVLELVAPVSMQELRASMIGTTKIVAKSVDEAPEEWGPSCRRTLKTVLDHESYASRRYYYHTYHFYFRRLYEALGCTVAGLRQGGQGVIVLQDSFYKDVNVPTPTICLEMLHSFSCNAEIVRTTPVRTNMGRINPRQNVYVPGKTFKESIVHFRRAN